MSDQASARSVAELRVTANMMRLEAGTYCAFVAPGSPRADATTGLPAVRLSAAPGPELSAGRVSVTGFGGEGWLAGRDDAALVRVAGGPANVLVTVYHSTDPAVEAPRVQVLRLSDPEPEPSAISSSGPPSEPPPTQVIEAVAHVYGRGDVGGRFGDWIGERGSRRWIEGFALQALRLPAPGEMEYQAVLGRDWRSPWVEAGQFCGSRGMSLPILGLEVRLRGPAAAAFEVVVSASFVDGTAIGPVRDGAVEAASLAALEAFQVVLEPKQAEADPPARPAGKRRR